MNSNEFHALDNTELSSACFSPIIPIIRGKSLDVKNQVYKQLLPGQKALFMFHAFYNHASNSLNEYFWWSAYYFSQPKAWLEILSSLRYFKADSMLEILEELEKFLIEENFPKNLEEFTLSQKQIEYYSNLPKIQSLYLNFNEISSPTLNKIGEYIRNNPEQFIQFVD